jgi:hypothetical protein
MAKARTKLCIDQSQKGESLRKKELDNFIIRTVECINYARHSTVKWGSAA